MLTTRIRRAALALALLLTAQSPAAAQVSHRTPERRVTGVRIKIEGSDVNLYGESHALVVGVSEYAQGWPSLSGVKEDVEKVSAELRRHGFTVDVVPDPTRAEFDRAMRRFFSRYGNQENGRLLFYFAGHGYTVKQSFGGSLGFVVPSDAPLPTRDLVGFRETAVPLTELQEYARQIDSRHALFVFDSCFSGAFFERGGRTPPAITSLAARPVRQFITAGTAEQTVPDVSYFRVQFVKGLEGAADANRDGYVTGSELGIFLEDTVANYLGGTQTPRWGKIRDPRLDQGDFVFVIPGPAPVASAPDPKALAEGYGAAGERLYAAKKFEEAENEFRLAAHFDRGDALWHLGLARSLSGQERYDEAEAEAREAARLAPADPAAFTLLGDALNEQKRRPDAEAAWREALHLSRDAARRAPAAAAPLGAAADALERLGQGDEALAARREAVRRAPRSAAPRAALSDLLWKLDKRKDEALAEMREAARLEPLDARWQDKLAHRLESTAGKAAEALEARRAALRLDPKNFRHYYALAYHFGCYGNYADRGAEILKVYREAVRNLPDEPEAYVQLASSLSGDKTYAEAEAVLREGLRRLPAASELYVALGELFARQSKDADAEAAYRKAIQLGPKDWRPYLNLGDAYRKREMKAEAEAVLRQGVSARPGDHFLLGALVEILRQQGKAGEVEPVYRRAMLHRPYETGLHIELARFFSATKKYAEAEREYLEAVRLDPQDAGLRASLAETLKEQGRKSDAVAAYREAMRLDREDYYYFGHYSALKEYLEESQDYAGAEALARAALSRLKEVTHRADAYKNLGLMLHRQGKEAEAAYRESLRLYPQFAWTHYALGITLSNQNKLPEAEAALREAVRLDSKDNSYREMLDKVVAARQK